jgi:hypothetical protein
MRHRQKIDREINQFEYELLDRQYAELKGKHWKLNKFQSLDQFITAYKDSSYGIDPECIDNLCYRIDPTGFFEAGNVAWCPIYSQKIMARCSYPSLRGQN